MCDERALAGRKLSAKHRTNYLKARVKLYLFKRRGAYFFQGDWVRLLQPQQSQRFLRARRATTAQDTALHC